VVAASTEDTVHTDAFAINWPPNSPVRVLANSATDALGARRYGHHPAALPREEIARDNGRALYRYSTDSPLRSTSGDLEAMALFAGQSAGGIDRVIPAAQRVAEIVAEARAILDRLRPAGEAPR
jgi:nitronate monooxygenase